MNYKRLFIRVLVVVVLTLLAIRTLTGPQVRELTQFRVYDRKGNIWIKRFFKYGDHGEFEIHFDQNGNPINGSCFSFHPLDNLNRQGWCVDGKFRGQVLAYSKEYKLVEEVNYKKGLRDGYLKRYRNGWLDRIYTYKKGKRHGLKRRYYQNGNIYCEYNYKNDKFNGDYHCYYKDGVVKEIGYFKNGQRHGTHWRWKRDGSLEWEMEFRNGWETKHNETYTVKSVISGEMILLDNDKRVKLKGIKESNNSKDAGKTSRQVLKELLKKGSRYVHVRLEFDGEPKSEGDWEAYVFVDTGHTRDTFPYIDKWPGPKDVYVDFFPIRLSYFINATMIKKKAAIPASNEGKYSELLGSLQKSP